MAASELVLAFVAGGFTTLGVVVKTGYDTIAARRQSKKERLERFAPERRAAYDNFLEVVKREQNYTRALRALTKRAIAGETEMSDEEQAAFPASPMPELMEALDRIRRLAHVYAVVTSAEAIVRLFGDMAGASRAALERPGSNDEITWFLLQRFVEDRIDEFVHAYREDLGIGRPSGAPKRWPIVERERPWPIDESEAILRAHIRPKKTSSKVEDL